MARPPPSASSSGTATPAAPPSSSSSSTGRPPNAPTKPDPMNLPHMIQLDKEGKLQPKDIQMLRAMIYKQARHVVASAALRGQSNPMTNLPPHLVPYSNINGHAAICTKQQWDTAIASGFADAKRVGEIMPMSEIKSLLAFSQEERAKKLNADPVLKLRFSRALTHYAQQTQRNAAQAAPPPPGSQRMETEDARRKRKFAEMLSDEGGGIQAELGVHEVLGQVLDEFIESVPLKAMRLANHRKSTRVEVKDIAYAIHDSTGITIPGHNVLPRDRIHTDGDKKRRTVMSLKARVKKDDA